ncbi:MAG: hypothetical protein ABI776_12035 [Nocardioidaceae bacterium]
MTNRPSNPRVRRAARVLALVPALLVTSATGVAFAEPPATWENTPPVSGLHVVLLLVMVPLALLALITLLVCLPSMSKGETYHPGQPWRGESEWFGGPRTGLEAVDSAVPPALTTSGPTRGGASGRW